MQGMPMACGYARSLCLMFVRVDRIDGPAK